MTELSQGDSIMFEPRNGGQFPTGERTRSGTIEAVRDNEIIVRQSDGFTDRTSPEQVI